MGNAQNEVADFSYDTASGAAHDAAGLPARVSVFADNLRTRSQIAHDLDGAGFQSVEGGVIADLVDGPITRLGDVVMIDCAGVGGNGLDARTVAALHRLDMRIARSGAQLIVSTSMEALDDVFGALDQSRAQILVQPTRGERLVAVGRVMASVSNARVREMSEEDRLSLLHLSQQVEAIAHKLEGLSEHRKPRAETAPMVSSSPADVSNTAIAVSPNAPASLYNSARPILPNPKVVRQMIAGRQARARFFDAELFADPAWDMLLDLTAAHAENARVSVTSLCIAAAVPATTALRWLKQMVESGIFERVADESDRRRAFIELSESSMQAMARYFDHIDAPLARAA
ncbi:MAG: MarR family transcriptional regulator [Pseudomonadota bacterium]